MQYNSFIINGSGGKKTLTGEISVSGSKNAAFPLLASTLLFDCPINYTNIPNVSDIDTILSWLESHDFELVRTKDKSSFSVKAPNTYKHIKQKMDPNTSIRGNIVFMGAMLGRFGEVTFSQPGGCNLGKRPIDMFIDFLQKFGAEISETDGAYTILNTKKLTGIDYTFHTVTVTGTAAAAMTAFFANGSTTLHNCAIEPEVISVLNFLKRSGVKIEGIGTRTLHIEGRGGELLTADNVIAINPPDRIQMGSYLTLGIMLGYDLSIKGVIKEQINEILNYFKDVGITSFEVNDDSIYIKKENKQFSLSNCESKNILATEYPAIPTDLQTILAVFATQLNGETEVTDLIYENRIKNQFKQMKSFGANVDIVSDRVGRIKGPSNLTGTEIVPLDLRSDFAFILMALYASGESVLESSKYVDRGYENIFNLLTGIGANIKRE